MLQNLNYQNAKKNLKLINGMSNTLNKLINDKF